MNKYAILIFALLFNISSCMIAQENDDIVKVSSLERSITKGKDIYLSGAIIEGKLDFTKLTDYYVEGPHTKRGMISSSITFINCSFSDNILAYKREGKTDHRISFIKNLTFINCEFNADVILKEIVVNGLANFSKSTFEGIVDIEGADFRSIDNYFAECIFNGKFKAQRTRFNGNVNFLKSEFFALASFQHATFNGDVQFGACVFYDHLDLSLIKATDNYIMNYVILHKKAIMNNGNYMGRVEFQQTVFNAAIEMKGNVYTFPVKFNNAIIEAEISVENSRFLSGMPELDNINSDKGLSIDFSKAQISTLQTIEK